MKKLVLCNVRGIFAVIIVTLSCLACDKEQINPKAINFIGEGELVVRLYRKDVSYARVANSSNPNKGNMTYSLPPQFLDFNRPNWWTDFQKYIIETQNDLLIHGYEPFFQDIPSEKWLKENTWRSIENNAWVRITLPHGSILQRRVDEEQFDDFSKRYPDEKGTQRFEIKETGEKIFSIWRIREGLDRFKGEYTSSLRDIRSAHQGQLVLRVEGAPNSVLIIQLPQQLMQIDPANLPIGYSQAFVAKVNLYYLQ